MAQKKQKNKEPGGKKGEDDDSKMRQRVRDFVDGKWVTIIMTMVTLWALFGDDIRVYSTSEDTDVIFYVTFVICFVLFAVELLLFSVVTDDYKYGFFFWLDVVATISMIQDIPWIYYPFIEIFNNSPPTVNVTASTKAVRPNNTGKLLARVLKSFRLIRVVRIVKLYKYVTKPSEDDEERKRLAQKDAQNAKQAALSREMEPQRLGKRLSDITTRRVIIVILLMLFLIPILQLTTQDNAKHYGLQELFWMGRSKCTNETMFGCESESGRYWIQTEEAWLDMVERYVRNGESSEGGSIRNELLWLYIPDWRKNGQFVEIKSVVRGYSNWTEDKYCGGREISSKCDLRVSEMLLVVYTPEACLEDDYADCSQLQAYARYEVTDDTKEEALYSIIVTLFVGLIMALVNFTFTVDTETIVVKPITKMMQKIQKLAEDPLSVELFQKYKTDKDKIDIYSKSLLEQAIYKIRLLLQQGFGTDGALIIRKNLMGGEGDLNIMRPGEVVNVIFGAVQIQNYNFVAEMLEEEVLIFTNQIGKIIHACATVQQGYPNINKPGFYLVIWKLPNGNDSDKVPDSEKTVGALKTELADRALISFVKIVAELKRSSEVQSYSKHIKITSKFNGTYEVQLGLALHMGQAVEGTIGSENYKVDAAYLSLHQEIVQRLVSYTEEEYSVKLLMTEQFYGILSLKAKNQCRKIDVLQILPSNNLLSGIYTFDMGDQVAVAPEKHTIGMLIKQSQLEQVKEETFHNKGVDYMFTLDDDLVTIQKQFTNHFYSGFRNAFGAYIQGEWQSCHEILGEVLEMMPNDGPSLALREFIEANNYKKPEGWSGYRSIDDIVE